MEDLLKKVVTIVFYVMRHGKKGPGPNDLATLTPEGREQVIQSAKNNLFQLPFDAFYCSEKFRTLETAACVASVLPERNKGMSVIATKGFDYGDVPDVENYGALSEMVAKHAEETGCAITIGLWEMLAPDMMLSLRDRFTAELLRRAEEVASNNPEKEVCYAFVGSHSPTSETACLDPDHTPLLKEADIMRYEVQIRYIGGIASGVKVKSSEVIDRGF